MLVGGQEDAVAGHLGHAVALEEVDAEAVDRPAQQVGRDGADAVGDRSAAAASVRRRCASRWSRSRAIMVGASEAVVTPCRRTGPGTPPGRTAGAARPGGRGGGTSRTLYPATWHSGNGNRYTSSPRRAAGGRAVDGGQQVGVGQLDDLGRAGGAAGGDQPGHVVGLRRDGSGGAGECPAHGCRRNEERDRAGGAARGSGGAGECPAHGCRQNEGGGRRSAAAPTCTRRRARARRGPGRRPSARRARSGRPPPAAPGRRAAG